MAQNEVEAFNASSENLERVRYKLLEQFCTLMQLNTYIHNFGKNTETLIEKSMMTSLEMLQEQLSKVDHPKARKFIENYIIGSKRNKTTLKLLYGEQERCWNQSRLCTQKAMLDFNDLASEIEAMLQKLEFYSMHDPLTGLHNRRYFDAILSYEVSRSERHDLNFCLLMIDLDNFKNINDTYGHFSGDVVLKQFSAALCERLRKSDVIARIGGDEFSILLVDTKFEEGKKVANSILKKINQTTLKDPEDHIFHISISVGLSHFPVDAKSAAEIKNCADQALYHAKELGKNQVAIYRQMKKQN